MTSSKFQSLKRSRRTAWHRTRRGVSEESLLLREGIGATLEPIDIGSIILVGGLAVDGGRLVAQQHEIVVSDRFEKLRINSGAVSITWHVNR